MKRTSFLLAGLLLGSSVIAQGAIATGRQQIGCATPPIGLQVTNLGLGVTFQPIPAGYGSVTGFYLIYFPAPANPLPPLFQSLPWGSSPYAPCCHPGPASMYYHTFPVVSPFESWTTPLPAGLTGLNAWVQGLLWRPPQGVPCMTYVTNQVEVVFT